MSASRDRTAAFVATSVIPPSPPPASEMGALHWLRVNLFSSVGNAIVTLLTLLLIAWVVAGIIDWAILRAVISPDDFSRRGCFLENEARELMRIAREKGISAGEELRILALPTVERVTALSDYLGVTVADIEVHYGACWALIQERFLQFVFGFYPGEEQWRPILTFVLLAPALLPILAPSAPRKLLWFSAAYPVIAYYLVWGGAIWGIALLALVVGLAAALGAVAARASNVVLGVAAGLALFLVLMLDWSWLIDELVYGWPGGSFYAFASEWLTETIGFVGLEPVETAKIGGVLLTMIIGVVGIVASLPLGILLALGRKSKLLVVRTIAIGFIEFIRGVPLITLLFVANVLLAYFLPPGTEFDKLLRVLIMVTLFASAYMAEVIRGGLAALPQGQYEAADALGLDYWQSMRLIILPQALKISIPGIVNTFIGLFKDTTLVSIIGLFDPLGMITPIRSDTAWTGIYWEPFAFVALFFFICCFGMSRYSMHLERKLATDRR